VITALLQEIKVVNMLNYILILLEYKVTLYAIYMCDSHCHRHVMWSTRISILVSFPQGHVLDDVQGQWSQKVKEPQEYVTICPYLEDLQGPSRVRRSILSYNTSD
jgi:hypothetical protein